MAEENYAALIRRIADNDTGAFEQLYHSLFPSAVQLARSLIGKNTEAEDLVHEVFLHLWENRNSLVSVAQIKSY